MSFYGECRARRDGGLAAKLAAADERAVRRALQKETPDADDFLALLSEAADRHLEAMARRAGALTLRNFGRVIVLYAPLYLGNFCDNECAYCGFKRSNAIRRRKLSLPELEEEARALAAAGILHVLALTGESRRETPPAYLLQAADVLRKHFASIAVEVYPLRREEYASLVARGVDGMTIYQETYDETLYGRLHLQGPKRDYRYRLDAPERACAAGMRSVSVGALLGLADFRAEMFLTGLHAMYLQNRYPGVEIGVSFPRLQPQTGNFAARHAVSDRQLVQAILALRLFLPRAGINISTRERSDFRKNLIGLGVTRMSAGSRTEVGGYRAAGNSEGQFEVSDTGSVGEVREMIAARGYQPVMKDWHERF